MIDAHSRITAREDSTVENLERERPGVFTPGLWNLVSGLALVVAALIGLAVHVAVGPTAALLALPAALLFLLALAAAALLVLMLLTLAVAVILVLILVGHDWFLSSVDAGECAAFTRAYKTRVMTKGFLKEQHGTRRSLSQLDSLCGEVIMDTGDSAPVARFASAAIAVVLILAVVLLLRVTLG